MSDCLFCKIAGGEIPSQKVYEDELVYAFYDIDRSKIKKCLYGAFYSCFLALVLPYQGFVYSPTLRTVC